MSVKNMGNLKVKESVVNTNDNDLGQDSEGLNTPQWNFYSNTVRNAHVKNVSRSINYDFRVIAKALESLASQVKMHAKRGIIPEKHNKELSKALQKIQKNVSNGDLDLSSASSVYDYIKDRINDMCPEASEWFNYVLSRPSQVAGDTAGLIRDNLDVVDAALLNMQSTLIERAEENVKTIFPTRSNNQLTQPTSFALHIMSYVEAFNRDRKRLENCKANNNSSPYCSGESSGTLQNINRDMVARNLGFIAANPNSINAINSYDSTLEFCTTLSIIAVNISRFANELSQWSSPSHRYITFSDEISQPHGVLPFHRENRAPELIIAEASNAHGAMNSAIDLLHAKPLAFTDSYNRLVEFITSAHDSVVRSINALNAMVADFSVNKKVTKEAASREYSTSIDLMNWLMKNLSLSPNEAKQMTQQILEYSINKGKKLSLLELSELKSFHKGITNEIYSCLIPSRAIISRRSGNGSNPVQIRKAIRAARRNYLY